MTVSTQIFSLDSLSFDLIPSGTMINLIKFTPNDIEVEVSHDDELTLLRLLSQIWGVEYDVLDLV